MVLHEQAKVQISLQTSHAGFAPLRHMSLSKSNAAMIQEFMKDVVKRGYHMNSCSDTCLGFTTRDGF